MRRLLLISALTLSTASAASALTWPGSSTIPGLTAGMNCQTYALTSATQRAPIFGVLPQWLVFNEGPAPVAIRSPGTRSRDIPVFDGRLMTVRGEAETQYSLKTDNTGVNDIISARGVLGANYTIGLSAGGSATVHVCHL
ncbi:MAG: hypothetical protein CML66_18985 [Rhodobacteraceae bacterium]|nr:hypothetical protein [Paracoccaceae bacterium]MAY45536.1 hypothetical protein [Paracoccaceae bacterium]